MTAVKDEARKLIEKLPDDCTFEDIQYHLYVVEKINQGIRRAIRASMHRTKKQNRD